MGKKWVEGEEPAESVDAAEGCQRLFDAAMTGREAVDSGAYLSIELSPGTYRIETHVVENPGDASVVLHVFANGHDRPTFHPYS